MIEISIDHASARLEATRSVLDAGTSGCKVLFFSGSQLPFGIDPTELPLATMKLNKGIGTISNGVLDIVSEPAPEGQVLVSGEVTWAAFQDGHGVTHIRCPVGIPGSGAPVVIDSLTVYAGGFIRLLAGQLM